MKIRLTQSKSGSTGPIERSPDLRNELFLQPLHLGGAWAGLVIVTSQVKEAVRDVETELVFQRCPESAGLAARHFRADHDLAVLKRNDIRGARFTEEAAMKLGHASIGNQNDADFLELRQHV